MPAFLATGDLGNARAVLDTAPPCANDAPTLTAAAIRLLANGLLATIAGGTLRP